MFIISLLSTLYGFLCLFIILLVLIQKGKSSMGLGNMGGSNQLLFGSSGGQDIFQKITWICCFLLLIGSLFLAIYKGKYGSRSYNTYVPAQQQPVSQDHDSDSQNA